MCSWDSVALVQEFLIEELARRAFEITAKSNRDIISYNDIGGLGSALFLGQIVEACKCVPLARHTSSSTRLFGCAASAVSQWPAAVFLQDIVPKRMPLSELIKRLRDTEQRQNGSHGPQPSFTIPAWKPARNLVNANE